MNDTFLSLLHSSTASINNTCLVILLVEFWLVVPLLLGLYESNLPSPSLNLARLSVTSEDEVGMEGSIQTGNSGTRGRLT